MSLPVPLTVRVVTSRQDRTITRDLRRLSFREVAQGGWSSAVMSLHRPLSLQSDEIAHLGRVYVYDGRSAKVVWEGRLDDPGRSAGANGQIWDLHAAGPAGHVNEVTLPLVYVDRRHEPWKLHTGSQKAYELDGIGEGTSNGLQLTIRQGGSATSGQGGRLAYDAIAEAGQLLARVSATWDTGTTSADDQLRLATNLNNSGGTTQDTDTWNTAGGSLVASRGGSPAITAGHNWCELQSFRTGTTSAVANENYWATFTAIVVRALLKTKAGADITTGYTLDTVEADDVVADLLGRVLDQYDGANAVITNTVYDIEQLAYPDGTTPGQVLEDLLTFEPGFRWGAYESNPAGKYRFEWVAWPTTVRYDVTADTGIDIPGSSDELFNRVLVRYRDTKGAILTTTRTQAVAVLDAESLIRQAFLDLGDEVGTLTNAQRAGDGFLAEHAGTPNRGRMTIARPLYDLHEGRRIEPYEIKAGTLIRVRGALPRIDALNLSTRDGSTVFRIAAKDYDAMTGMATLELESPSRTASRNIAAARATNEQRKRRR